MNPFKSPRLQILLFATLVCLALLGPRLAGADESWPTVPSPPRAEVKWVGQDMKVNGVPTRILQFDSKAAAAEVVEYYRSYWSGGYDKQPSVKPLGAATVVGQMHGPYLMTVKIEEAGGGSRGVISIARLLGSKAVLDPGPVKLPPGARVLSVVESQDPGKHSREVVAWNPQSAAAVLHYYESALAGAGWHPMQANFQPATAERPSGGFAVYARDAEELQLSVTELRKMSGSTVTANQVTKDTAR